MTDSSKTMKIQRKFSARDAPQLVSQLEKLGARLVNVLNTQDFYYDSKDFKLTQADMWLRCRSGTWQLKYPIKSSAAMVKYRESGDEFLVDLLVKQKAFLHDNPADTSLNGLVVQERLVLLSCVRNGCRWYELGGCTVIMQECSDLLDGLCVVELETVPSEDDDEDDDDAFERVEDLAQKLNLQLWADTNLKAQMRIGV